MLEPKPRERPQPLRRGGCPLAPARLLLISPRLDSAPTATAPTPGLAHAPNTGDNCVHASASPFEGFAERTNWLKDAYTFANDPFGKLLLAAGISEATLKAWSVDPQVLVPGGGGKKASLFDQVEDMDVEDCVKKCVEINAANSQTVS